MNSKAQIGLDYLISYGWAFVLLASFLGVLVFVLYPIEMPFECTLSDPKNFKLESSEGFIASEEGGSVLWKGGIITIQNISGERVSVASLKKDGYFNSNPTLESRQCETISNATPVSLGNERLFEIGNLEIAFDSNLSVPQSGCDFFLGGENTFGKKSGKIYISLEDERGQPHELSISCKGFPSTPREFAFAPPA